MSIYEFPRTTAPLTDIPAGHERLAAEQRENPSELSITLLYDSNNEISVYVYGKVVSMDDVICKILRAHNMLINMGNPARG